MRDEILDRGDEIVGIQRGIWNQDQQKQKKRKKGQDHHVSGLPCICAHGGFADAVCHAQNKITRREYRQVFFVVFTSLFHIMMLFLSRCPVAVCYSDARINRYVPLR